jgi:hypothetical protein
MATIAERLAKLGAKLAPWIGWVIANNYTTYRQAYDNEPQYKALVDSDPEASELIEELDSLIDFSEQLPG